MTTPTDARHPIRRARWTGRIVTVLAARELRGRYRQSVLDIAWALITPVAVAAVYGIVLTRSFDVDGRGAPYLSMAWTGLVAWTFFATSLSAASASAISSSDLITKVYFPREALPLSMVAAALVDLGIGLVTVVILLPAQGVSPTWSWILAVVPLLILIVWAAGLSILVGVVSAFVRDVPHLVGLLVRVGFFATPVMYEVSVLPDALQWTAQLSPIAVAIGGLRDALLYDRPLDATLVGIHLVAGLAVLAAAIAYTRSIEARIADVV